MAERLHHYVKGHPGQGIEQISESLDIASKELKLPVVKLLAMRKLRTEGQKRGTRYFAGAQRGARRQARRVVRKARRVVRRPRRVAKKAARMVKRVVRRPRAVAKKVVRRRVPAMKKTARRPRRIVKKARRKAAPKVIVPNVAAPKPRPAAKKPVVAPETPSSMASTLAQRVAVAS